MEWSQVVGTKSKKEKKKKKRSENANSADESATTTQPSLEPTPVRTPKKTVVIQGDSIVKNVQGWKLSTNARSVVKAFPGAKVEDMFHYIKPTLNQQPDEIILHVGTNDIKHLAPRAIAERIVDLGNNIVSQCPNIKVTISNLLCRSDDGLLNAREDESTFILSC